MTLIPLTVTLDITDCDSDITNWLWSHWLTPTSLTVTVKPLTDWHPWRSRWHHWLWLMTPLTVNLTPLWFWHQYGTTVTDHSITSVAICTRPVFKTWSWGKGWSQPLPVSSLPFSHFITHTLHLFPRVVPFLYFLLIYKRLYVILMFLCTGTNPVELLACFYRPFVSVIFVCEWGIFLWPPLYVLLCVCV